LKAIFTPSGKMYLDFPPEFPNLLRNQPALDMRAFFDDWSLTGWEL
jgi:hypothetical protein